jgi:hypothetical protein
MFVNLSIKDQIAILNIKINEIKLSKDYTENDKKQMTSFYQKKLKVIQPNTKF